MTPAVSLERHPRLFHRRWWANALCATGALAIHALLVSPVVLGTAGPQRPRMSDVRGPGASAIVSSAEFVTLVLISEPESSVSRESVLDDLASRGIARDDLTVRILSPDPNPAFDVAEDEAAEHVPHISEDEPGDMQERALLFSRYLNQVSARIERAWIKPAAPAYEPLNEGSPLKQPDANLPGEPDDVFDCEVRILQDARGKVLEIMLLDCDDSLTWQQSLVAAIQHASPLPAPPHPKVFTSALKLRFEGRPHSSLDADKDHDGTMSVALGLRAKTNNVN